MHRPLSGASTPFPHGSFGEAQTFSLGGRSGRDPPNSTRYPLTRNMAPKSSTSTGTIGDSDTKVYNYDGDPLNRYAWARAKHLEKRVYAHDARFRTHIQHGCALALATAREAVAQRVALAQQQPELCCQRFGARRSAGRRAELRAQLLDFEILRLRVDPIPLQLVAQLQDLRRVLGGQLHHRNRWAIREAAWPVVARRALRHTRLRLAGRSRAVAPRPDARQYE